IISCAGTDDNKFIQPVLAVNTGTVQGFVLDQSTNPPSPVIGAQVLTVPVGGTAITTAAGFYKMENVEGGFYEVKASKGVGEHASVKLSVKPAMINQADINFNPAPLNIGREIFFITDTSS